MKKIFLTYILFLISGFISLKAQNQATESKGKKIEIIHADYTNSDQYEIPGAIILTGNIQAQQDSLYIYCNKAYFFQNDNYIKLFGNVSLIQNDTLSLKSKYAEYNGNQGVAFAQGNVVMQSPESSLTSETVYYDKNNGVAYYNDHATIVNRLNTLKSKVGKYFTQDQRYEFRDKVVLTNPQNVIKTDHLDFYEVSGHAYLFGPSTITNKEDFIYTENGFYDTQNDIGKLYKNSYIVYDEKRIQGDEIFYDKKKSYSKLINNVRVDDPKNKMVMTSHFAEVYQSKDSIYITKKPLVKSLVETDSVYFYAKNIIITGPDKAREISGFKNARMFRTPDMSAKADSLHMTQKIGLTQFFGNPVIFKGESQITGKLIQILNNPITEKLDSLKVLVDAFVIERDTLGTGYNQAKGINLYGKFKDNKISDIELNQNAEMIYYLYDEDNILTGIDKGICSRIHMELEANKITTATRYVNPEAITYPPKDFPENISKLRGFNWRGNEKINSVAEIFPQDELEAEVLIQQNAEEQKQNVEKPIEVQKETKNFKSKESKNSIKKIK